MQIILLQGFGSNNKQLNVSFPVLFHIGSAMVSLHGVLETAAFFVGFRYFIYLRKKCGDLYSSSSRVWVIIGAIFGALLGSRILGSLERPHELLLTNNLWEYFYSNKTVLGGFLGGLFGVELVKKIIGERQASGDLFVYPILLALIIGRFGCFSMGVFEETYGVETHLPWGMNLGDGIYRHPIMLYEIIFLSLLWITLKKIHQIKDLQAGALFKLFMIGYLLFRFMIDFIKPHYPVFLGLNSIQLASIAGLIYYMPYLIQPKRLMITYA
jgi:phosphatidylglycerol:prolipoprotein diacylglycerol transferase